MRQLHDEFGDDLPVILVSAVRIDAFDRAWRSCSERTTTSRSHSTVLDSSRASSARCGAPLR